MTREQWLNQFVRAIRPIFRAAGYPLPEIKVDIQQMPHTVWVNPAPLEIIIADNVHDGIRAAEILVRTLIWKSTSWFEPLAVKVGYATHKPCGKRLSPLLTAVVDEMPPYPQVYSRAEWLKLFTREMRSWFKKAGIDLPNIEVFPGQILPGYPNVGTVLLEDGRCHIYLVSSMKETFSIATLLTYEFARCAVGFGGDANSMAAHVGLSVSSWGTQGGFTYLQLVTYLTSIIADLGPYPEK